MDWFSEDVSRLRKEVRFSASLLLLLRGCNFFTRSRVHGVIRSLFLLYLILMAHVSLFKVWHLWQTHGFALITLGSAAQIVGSITCNVALVWRRGRCESFLKRIVASLPIRDLVLLKQEILHLNLLAMSMFLVQVLSKILSVKGKMSTMQILGVVAKLVPNFAVFTSAFYCIVVKILIAYHRSLLTECMHRLSTGRQYSQPIHSATKKIRVSSEEFEHLFNVLPATWFFYGIIDCPNVFATMRLALTLKFVIHLIYVTTVSVAPIIAVFAVSQVQSRFLRQVDDLQDEVMLRMNDRGPQVVTLVYHLESLKALQFTGLSSFVLDRSFIVTYIGTLVTFAALIREHAKDTGVIKAG